MEGTAGAENAEKIPGPPITPPDPYLGCSTDNVLQLEADPEGRVQNHLTQLQAAPQQQCLLCRATWVSPRLFRAQAAALFHCAPLQHKVTAGGQCDTWWCVA